MASPTGPDGPGSCEPCEHGVEVLLEAREGRIEQLSAWDHHDVDSAERQRRHVFPENLSDQPFRSISPNRVPKFFRRNDAQASFAGRPPDATRDGPLGHEHGEKASPATLATIENLLELPSPPDSPALIEPGGWIHRCTKSSGVTWLRRGDREAFPSFGAAPFQDLTPLLGAHAHEKTMRTRTTLAIRLKRSFPFGHDVGSTCKCLRKPKKLE
jgi:hypothetical protein